MSNHMMYKSKGLSQFKELRKLMVYIEGIRGYIAGGCFKDIFGGNEAKDIDIFFDTESDLEQGIRYYDNLVANGSGRWVKVYSTDNSNGYRDEKEGVLVDLVKKVYNEDKDGMIRTIDRFDFTVTKAVMYKDYGEEDSLGDNLFDEENKDTAEEVTEKKTYRYMFSYHIDFFEDLAMKRLRYAEDDVLGGDPINMLNRVIRYTNKGFKPTLELKKELIQYISGIDKDNILTILNTRVEDNEDEQYEDIDSIEENRANNREN